MRWGLALTVLMLAACGTEEPVAVPDDDPALAAALAGPILVDPDLVGQNRANSAVALPSHDGSLPSVDAGPEVIAAARDEALELVGGPGRMRQAPEGENIAVPDVELNCGEHALRTALWAARMPAAFPVYPRGAVQEAIGTDSDGCALRRVNFITPVPLDEVIDFYFTRARAAGYSTDRIARKDDNLLAGKKGAAAYTVSARRLSSGNTEVDLVTNG
jgi:hypothetical protein